jgi:membrane protein DedA with SNARE-associated domain
MEINAAGGIVWGTGMVLVAYLAGNSYAAVDRTVGRAVAVAVAGPLSVALVVWRVRADGAERSGRTPKR